jgi:hypothetical protein
VPTSALQAYAYEGGSGAASLFMPVAACGVSLVGSKFEVQNAGAVDATVSVDYYYLKKTTIKKVTQKSPVLGPGKKAIIDTCRVPALLFKPNVTAVISAADGGGNPVPVAAVGKVIKGGINLLNAYGGQVTPTIASDGKYRIVLPSVEWAAAKPGYRTTVEIQNAAVAAGTPANVTLTWYDRTSGAHAMPATIVRTRLTTTPKKAGLTPPGTSFAGALVVESDQPVVATARTQKMGYLAADGYNGIAAP